MAQAVQYVPVEILADIGAGSGWFADLCIEKGIAKRVVAVEPNPGLADTCRRIPGVEVIEAPIEACYSSLEADVITCFELIEHLFNPADFLHACLKGLKSCGMIICTTPNWHGFDIALLRERSDNVGGPNHLQLFTPSSLAALLQRVGFSDIIITTPGQLDVDILYNKMKAGIFEPAELPYFGPLIHNGSEEFKKDLQSFIQRHGLSSNMMAIARKHKT